MANQITVTLAKISSEVIEQLLPEAVDLASVSLGLGDDVPDALTVDVPIVAAIGASTVRAAGATADFDYEATADQGIDKVRVTLQEISHSWSINRNELLVSGLAGSTAKKLLAANARKYLESVHGIAYAPLTHANFGTEVTLAADAVLAKAQFIQLRKALNTAGVPKASRFLVANDVTDLAFEQAALVYDKEAAVEGSVGRFAGLDIFESPYMPTIYTGTTTTRKRLIGYAGGPSGLGVALRAAQDAPEITGEYIYSEKLTIGSIPMLLSVWVKRGSKKVIFNLNGYAGAAVGQAAALKRIVIADPTA